MTEEKDSYMQDEMINKLIANQEEIIAQNREIIYSQIFHDTIKGSEWLPEDFPFSPGREAFGYPALYVLYRILNEFRPVDILETGLGQSTKMISMYSRHKRDCRHCIVEHDGEWIGFFRNHFQMPETTEIMQLPIMDADIDLGEEGKSNVTTYSGFSRALEGRKFDFMCIDGPYGFRSPVYSRIDLIGILPGCLKERFVILLDDCHRQGELNTLNMMASKLNDEGIECSCCVYNGEKGTGLLVSKGLSFLCSM